MVDTTYGHLARDSEEPIRARLDGQAARRGVEVMVDAGTDPEP